MYVAVGDYGAVYTSPAGVEWTEPNSGNTSDLKGITYGNKKFVAVGAGGTVLTSPDGVMWTSRVSEVTLTLQSVAYAQGVFTAVWAGGVILTSPDGVTWRLRPSGSANLLYDVTYGKQTFVVVGHYGQILQSAPLIELMSSSTSPNDVWLSWQSTGFTETGFAIERKTGDCDGAGVRDEIAETPVDMSSYHDSSPLASTLYSYRVRAFNTRHFIYSNCSAVETAKFGTPLSPTEQKAKARNSTIADLTWQDNSTDETKFVIYRSTGDGPFALLASSASNVNSFTDTSAIGNSVTTRYTYVVKACNVSGCSPPTKCAMIPHKPYSFDGLYRVNEIVLTWKDGGGYETNYIVERKSGPCIKPGVWSVKATLEANILNYSDEGIDRGRHIPIGCNHLENQTVSPLLQPIHCIQTA